MTTEPKKTKQAKELGKFTIEAAKTAISTGQVMASEEEANRRFAICLSCPLLVFGKKNNENVSKKCSICGCTMSRKVKFQAAKCADKQNPKW